MTCRDALIKLFDGAAEDGECLPEDNTFTYRHDVSGVEASFALGLESVGRIGGGSAPVLAAPSSGTHGQVESFPTLAALIHTLAPEQTFRVVHSMQPAPRGLPRYEFRVEGSARGADARSAAARARALLSATAAALEASAPALGLAKHPPPPAGGLAWTCRRSLVPAGIAVDGRAAGTIGFAATLARPARLVLPMPPREARCHLGSTIAFLLSARRPVELAIEFSRRAFTAADLDSIADAHARLLSEGARSLRPGNYGASGARLDPGTIVALHESIARWLLHPRGATLRVELYSRGPLPAPFLHVAGMEIFQGVPFDTAIDADAVRPAASLDLSMVVGLAGSLPPFLPDPRLLTKEGYRRHYARPRMEPSVEGIRIGRAAGPGEQVEVRLGTSERTQHCYVVGATGTGKSTLLRQMIEQDITDGQGVGVLDPHGDLFQEVLAAIPEHRVGDLVVLDFTRCDAFVGINLLECRTGQPELERNAIVHDLAAIFEGLYARVPESMGPAFRQYMRNAVLLVMSEPGGQGTLLDVPRVFADTEYRNCLINTCPDAAVRDFWRGIAGRVSGEHSIANFGPYVTNKFTEFTQNALVRLVVGQSRSTVDFQEILDNRRILLVNLSRGLIGPTDASFLGMILTSRLLAAATSRARQLRAARVPFHLYVDEFQHFVASPFDGVLAEGRKFGLSLTLAHQHLGQLNEQQRTAVLGNVASKILLRVGPQDATVLEKFISPHFDGLDLTLLEDLHAVAQIKINGRPASPFVLRIDNPAPVQAEVPRMLVDQSLVRYTRPAEEVRRGIELRRFGYLLRLSPREAGFVGPLLEECQAAGARVLADVLPISAEQHDRYLKLAAAGPSKAAADAMAECLGKLAEVQRLQSQPAPPARSARSNVQV